MSVTVLVLRKPLHDGAGAAMELANVEFLIEAGRDEGDAFCGLALGS
jgi:hypothetical protein